MSVEDAVMSLPSANDRPNPIGVPYLVTHATSAITAAGLFIVSIVFGHWSHAAPLFTTSMVAYATDTHTRVRWSVEMVPLLPLILTLCALTAAYHVGALFLWRRDKASWLSEGRAPLRNVHTALTSPLRLCIVLYAAGLHEATTLGVFFVNRWLIFSLIWMYERISRPVNEEKWSLPTGTQRGMVWIIFGAYTLSFVLGIVAVVNVNMVASTVDNTFGLVLFATHSITGALSVFGHCLVSMQPPREFWKTEFFVTISETCDLTLIVVLLLVYQLTRPVYVWNEMTWSY